MSAVRPRYAGDAPPVTHRAPTVYRSRRPERTVVLSAGPAPFGDLAYPGLDGELDGDPHRPSSSGISGSISGVGS